MEQFIQNMLIGIRQWVNGKIADFKIRYFFVSILFLISRNLLYCNSEYFFAIFPANFL